MTIIPLIITTFCYLWASWGFYRQGQAGLGLAFGGYALANAGFIYICLTGTR